VVVVTDAEKGRARSRRRVLSWLWGGFGLVAVAEAGWVVLSFARSRRRPKAADASEVLVAGPVEAFAHDTVTAFPAGRFYLVRRSDGGFLALHRECPHLGCTVPWNAADHRFDCPCHASSFDLEGRVLSPPATRPLDRLAVRIEHGLVKVVVSERIRRLDVAEGDVVFG
jgi:cytochrome b6-f complex iron-sulfur subunit